MDRKPLDLTTFLGFEQSQSMYAIPYWEKLLFSRDEAKEATVGGIAKLNHDLSRIIEIGSGQGNFSFYLYLISRVHDLEFSTYEINHSFMTQSEFKRELGFYDHAHQKDCFSSDIAEQIARPGGTLLFCDGGNKPREFNHFARFLKPGDLIGAHDWEQEEYQWSVETKYAQVEPAIKEFGLREITIPNQEAALTRFFVRVDSGV